MVVKESGRSTEASYVPEKAESPMERSAFGSRTECSGQIKTQAMRRQYFLRNQTRVYSTRALRCRKSLNTMLFEGTISEPIKILRPPYSSIFLLPSGLFLRRSLFDSTRSN